MDVPAPPAPEAEINPDKERLAWEAERIAEARAELDAGFYVDGEDVDLWLQSFGTDHQLPAPRIRRA